MDFNNMDGMNLINMAQSMNKSGGKKKGSKKRSSKKGSKKDSQMGGKKGSKKSGSKKREMPQGMKDFAKLKDAVGKMKGLKMGKELLILSGKYNKEAKAALGEDCGVNDKIKWIEKKYGK